MTISYSIIIPAYNEEKWLPKTLDILKKSVETLEAEGEIIVVFPYAVRFKFFVRPGTTGQKSSPNFS